MGGGGKRKNTSKRTGKNQCRLRFAETYMWDPETAVVMVNVVVYLVLILRLPRPFYTTHLVGSLRPSSPKQGGAHPG